MNNPRKIIGLSFDLYLEFFVSEIPNFIQILSVLTILSSLLTRESGKGGVFFWMLFTLFIYITLTGQRFLENNLLKSLRRNNVEVKDSNLDKVFMHWYIFVVCNMTLFYLLLNYLTNIIQPL